VTDFGLNGKEAETILDTVNITVNKNSIPFEKLSPLKQVVSELELQRLQVVDSMNVMQLK
jgi:hypothetical protein